MNGMPPNKKEQRKRLMIALSFVSQVGVTLLACVLIGVLLGRFLDSLLGTAPWMLLLFSLFGVGAAIKSLFDMGKNSK